YRHRRRPRRARRLVRRGTRRGWRGRPPHRAAGRAEVRLRRARLPGGGRLRRRHRPHLRRAHRHRRDGGGRGRPRERRRGGGASGLGGGGRRARGRAARHGHAQRSGGGRGRWRARGGGRRAAGTAGRGAGRQADLPAETGPGEGGARRRGRLSRRGTARTVRCGRSRVRVGGRVVTPDGIVDGAVEVEDGRITAIQNTNVHSGHFIVPGFVDMHVHGGGGYTFTTGDPDQARGAAAFHLSHGTTTLLASLVSSPYELMQAAVKAYAPLVDEGVLAGVHFEGPYLSELRCGAQNPRFLRDPSTRELTELVDAGGGTVRMVTLAPERPGALAAIDLLVRHG